MVAEEFFIGLWAFILGFFSAIAATGPVTFLVFQNSLLGKHKKAFLIILGASIMDVIYCSVALIFIGAIFSYGRKIQILSRVFSLIILIAVGIYLFKTKKIKNKKINIENLSLKEKTSSFLTGFVLIALNPSIILTWSAAMTVLISFNAIMIHSLIDSSIFILFAGIGIIMGGLSMIFSVKLFRPYFSENFADLLLKFAGIVVVGIALYFLFDLIELIF